MIERHVTCKTLPVSRAKGHTAVGGAAYRAAENIKARGHGADGADKWFRYSARRDTVRETFILVPHDAPDYAHDRAELWNRVEEMETRKNARLGRDTQLGFAYELPKAEQRKLLIEFVEQEFVARGFVADVAIHDYGRTVPAAGGSEKQRTKLREAAAAGIPFLERDEAKASEEEHFLIVRNRQGEATGYKLYQPHAHVRITPRAIRDGEWVDDKNASRYFNKPETAKNWRYDWPKLQNGYLERVGSDVRVRATSEEEDAWPLLKRQATGDNPVTHAIGERQHELTDEQRANHEEAKAREAADREFRRMHNETLRQAFKDEHSASTPQERSEHEARRITAWWRNMSQRYHHWRDDFREQTSEWGERFRLQKERMKLLLGWHIEPPQEAPPPRVPESSRDAADYRTGRDEREQER
jgi:hypothetical protein